MARKDAKYAKGESYKHEKMALAGDRLLMTENKIAKGGLQIGLNSSDKCNFHY